MDKIKNFKLGYFVFSFFISSVVIYIYHQGFDPIDILNVPILTIFIFLFIDIIVSFTIKKNTDSFIQEKFLNHIDTQDNIENFESLMEEEEDIYNDLEPTIPIEPVETTPSQQMMTTSPPQQNEPTMPYLASMDEQMSKMEETMGAKPKMDKSLKKPDVNEHQMETGLENDENVNMAEDDLTNTNINAVKPVNINISYNNNKPYTHNDFSQSDGIPNINKHLFDDGRNVASSASCPPNQLLNPVNQTTMNKTLQNMNQSYYPAYLQNPLNKNQQGTSILSTINKDNEPENLLRPNPSLQPETKQEKRSKYLENSLKNICNNPENDPAPVLLNDVWSEFRPLDLE